MLKRLLLLFSITLAATLNAQTVVTHPFPTDSAVWYESRNTLFGPWGAIYTCNEKYFYNGVETMNNNVYHKVYSLGKCTCVNLDPQYNNCVGYPFYHDTSYTNILLRVDSNKVIIKEGSNSEFKLYDYNKTVGDTMIYQKTYFGDTIVLQCVLIDSTLTNIGYLKQWNFTMSQNGFSWGCPFDTLKWIEGATSNHGVFYHWALDICNTVDQGDDSQTLCFAHRDTFILGGGLQTCEFPIIIGVDESTIQPEISIYPNPATNSFTIQLPQAQKFTVGLYNLIGQQVVSYIETQNQLVIERNNLPAGLYFVRIDNGNATITKKIIFE